MSFWANTTNGTTCAAQRSVQRLGSGVQQMLRQRCRRGEELGAAPQRACRLRRQGSRRAGAPCFPSSRTSCMRHLRRQRTRTVSVGAATGHSCRTGGRRRSKQNAAQCEQYRVRAPSPGPIPRPRSSQRPWRPLATWRARSAAARCPEGRPRSHTCSVDGPLPLAQLRMLKGQTFVNSAIESPDKTFRLFLVPVP
eukprot:COSAG06_NODE_70_length_25948_cov_5.079757_10_plen_195_part_00